MHCEGATLAGKRVLVDLANAGQFTYLEEASAMNRACGHDVLTKPRVHTSQEIGGHGGLYLLILICGTPTLPKQIQIAASPEAGKRRAGIGLPLRNAVLD